MSKALYVASTGSAGHAATEHDHTLLLNHISLALYQLFGSMQFVEHLSVKPTRDFAELQPCSQVSHGYVLDECAKAIRANPQAALQITITDLLRAADQAFDTRSLLNVGLTLSNIWMLPPFDPRRRDDNLIKGPKAGDLLRVPKDFKVHVIPFTKSARELAEHIESLSSEDAFFAGYKTGTSQLEALYLATTPSQCFIVDIRACTEGDLDKIATAASGALCAKFGLAESGPPELPPAVENLVRATDDITEFITDLFHLPATATSYENLVYHVLGKFVPLDALESSWKSRPFSVRQIRHCATKATAAILMLSAARRRYPNTYRRKWSLIQDSVYTMYK